MSKLKKTEFKCSWCKKVEIKEGDYEVGFGKIGGFETEDRLPTSYSMKTNFYCKKCFKQVKKVLP